jgi:uncharacterized protein DUF4326
MPSPACTSGRVTVPDRIQLSRKRGYRKPPGAVVVSRPSVWGNPFVIGEPHALTGGRPVRDREEAYGLYKLHTGEGGTYELDVAEVRRVLGGRDLACWCDPPAVGEPDFCHAAVLLAIANPED